MLLLEFYYFALPLVSFVAVIITIEGLSQKINNEHLIVVSLILPQPVAASGNRFKLGAMANTTNSYVDTV